PADVVALARWAAWRWAGRPGQLLGTASPPRSVRALPSAAVPSHPTVDPEAAAVFAGGVTVVRLPPPADVLPLAVAAAARGDALVLAPSVAAAAFLAARLRQEGAPVALVPQEWARAAAGGCVALGARAAAWAPRPRPGAV